MRRTGTATGLAALVTAAFLVPASATTTVTGGDAGTDPPVIRGASTTITSDGGAVTYFRTGANSTISNVAYAAQTLSGVKTLALVGRLCRGDNPNPGVWGGTGNESARQIITVTDPSNNVVATAISPARDISLLGGGGPLATQPGPAATNYRGDFPTGSGASHGMSFTLSLTGRASGTYTVTTNTYNTVRQLSTGTGGSLSACAVGTPNASAGNKTFTPGPVTTTTTFIYRPWQNTFVDVFGAGKVFANTLPHEYQFSFGAAAIQQSQLFTGANTNMHLYAFPSTDPFLLPNSSCLTDPVTCLPAAAVPCDPSDGCTPRIMTINDINGAQKLQGVFDLQTKAFLARANLNGVSRLLVSTGTANDALIASLLTKLKNGAAAKGINLESLLNTKVRLANGTNELDITLLQGLQIAPSSANGVQIVSDTTVQAGLILDVYVDLRASACPGGTSASNTSVPPRYTATTGYGYTVQKSDILPAVPSVGPLGAIASGPIFHITGKFAENALANTASAVLGVDSAADEPNGYPVWVEPFLSAGHVNSPSTMDFLGTATWSAGETNLGAFGCLVSDLMLGTGVALYNNPLPVGFGTLLSALYKPSAASAKLLDEINAAVQNVVGQASANPTVAALLGQLLGALPTG